MRCDYPTAAQIPGLRALWKEAFEDTDLFLDAFFDRGFHPRRCRCITEQGAVLAALYWFEVNCGRQKYAYLYAVATAKSHRGRGLFGILLENDGGNLIRRIQAGKHSCRNNGQNHPEEKNSFSMRFPRKRRSFEKQPCWGK